MRCLAWSTLTAGEQRASAGQTSERGGEIDSFVQYMTTWHVKQVAMDVK